MGAVYLAEDTRLGRRVALQVPTLSGPTADASRARFLREAQSAATLRHPNICPIHDLGEIDGVPYLTMAFIQGEPLAWRVGPDRLFEPRAATAIVRKLALALQTAHEQGVIHRDLKPANIMIDERGEPCDYSDKKQNDSDVFRTTASHVKVASTSVVFHRAGVLPNKCAQLCRGANGSESC